MFTALAPAQTEPAVGKAAPAFTLSQLDGKRLSLKDPRAR
jgi:hypothetical protein